MPAQAQAKRDSIERALIHHNVNYSPPGPGRSTWLLSTSTGRKEATTTQAEWFCIGLATRTRDAV